MEDYEKKYKEALEKARNIVNSINVGLIGKDSFEVVFPELKESEDERNKRTLKEFLNAILGTGAKTYLGNWNKEDLINWISWLEKQNLKFKVGDLIINKDGNGKVKQILEATNFGYTTNDGFAIREIYEKNYRTCEIKDICQWKPSDEQMFDLKCAADSNSNVLLGQSLLSLYNDLNKLKE